MSYKIGLILSFIFVVMFFVFSVDVLGIQFVYTDLDTKAVSIAYIIAKEGTLEEKTITYIESYYDVDFVCESNCTPRFGDIVEFRISSFYDPLIIAKSTMVISIKRCSVIGYYE